MSLNVPLPLAPPLAPFVPTAEQERFLAIHAKHVVVKWVWHFKETLLRAYTERGLSAAISRGAVDDLVTAGLMEWGFGCADCRVTDAGKDMLTNCLMVVRCDATHTTLGDRTDDHDDR